MTSITQEQLKNNFSGITVCGDIHGNIDAMQAAVNHSSTKGHFFLSLGDLVDYGTNNYECIILMEKLIRTRTAGMIEGNHDNKMFRYLSQRVKGDIKVQIKGGMLTTVAEFEALTPDEQNDFYTKFMTIYQSTKLHWIVDNVMFVHGGSNESMWLCSDINDKVKNWKSLKARALYGQVDRDIPKRDDGLPNRVYTWVDDIANNRIVVFGHDVRSRTAPVAQKGSCGGLAIALDTGSSKDGILSVADFEFGKDSLIPLGYKSF